MRITRHRYTTYLNFLLPSQTKAEEARVFKVNKNYIESVNGGKSLFKKDLEVEERIDGLLEIKFKDKKLYVKEDYSGLHIKQGNKKYELAKDHITSNKSDLTGLMEVKSITMPEEIWDSEETTLTADYLGQKGQVEKIAEWPLVIRSPKTIEDVGQVEQIDTRPPIKTRAGKAISGADSNTRTETALPNTQVNIYKIYYEDEDLFNKHKSQPQGYEENGQLYEYIENNQVRYGHLDEDKNLVSKGATTIGIEKDHFDKYFKGAEKLAGAYFEIRNNDKTDKNNYNKIIKAGYTDEKGVLRLELEAGNYRIEENLEKSDYRRISDGKRIEGAYRQKALPILVDLPVLNTYLEDKEKGYIKEIHLYPKNTVIKPLIEKKLVYRWDENTFLDKKANDFEVGEDIYWQIDLSLPVKTSYQALKILDLASLGIDLKDLVKVSLNGGKMDEDLYRLKEKNKLDDFYIDNIYPDKKLEDYYQKKKNYEFTITNQGLEKINTSLAQDLDDVKISLIVKGRLNGDFYIERQENSPDLFNRNMAILDYQVVDNYQVLDYDISEVRTGGRQFIKKNTLGESLEGAEFLVLKKNHKDYDYLIIKDNHFIDWTKDPAQANVFESGQDGVLRTKQAYGDRLLRGLRDGRYYLEEIKAPKDYGKLVNLKEFLISRNSFYGQDSLEIINTRLVLPETGSIGSIIFIAFGLLLIGLGYKFKNRKKR